MTAEIGISRVQRLYPQAAENFEEALALEKAAHHRSRARIAENSNQLATVNEVQGRFAEAERLYRSALAAYGKPGGPEPDDVARYLENLSGMLRDCSRTDEADLLLALRLSLVSPEAAN